MSMSATTSATASSTIQSQEGRQWLTISSPTTNKAVQHSKTTGEEKENDGGEKQATSQPSNDIGGLVEIIQGGIHLPSTASIPPHPVPRIISEENNEKKFPPRQSPQSAGKSQKPPKTISNLPYVAQISESLKGARVLIPVCLPVKGMESWLHPWGNNSLLGEELLHDKLSKIEALFFELDENSQKSIQWVRFVLVDTPMALTCQNFQKNPAEKLDEKLFNSEIKQPADMLFTGIKTLLEKYFPKKYELWRWADIECKEEYAKCKERVCKAYNIKESPYRRAIFDNAHAWLVGKGIEDTEKLKSAILNNVEVLQQECAAFVFFTDEKPPFTCILDSTKPTEAERATRVQFPTSSYIKHVHYSIRKNSNTAILSTIPDLSIGSSLLHVSDANSHSCLVSAGSSVRGNTFDVTTASSLHNIQSCVSIRASASQEGSTGVLPTTKNLSAQTADVCDTNVKNALTSLSAVKPSQSTGSLEHRASSAPLSMFYDHGRSILIRDTKKSASVPIIPDTSKAFVVKDTADQHKVVTDVTAMLVQAVACVQDPQYAAQFAHHLLQLTNTDLKPELEGEVAKVRENMTTAVHTNTTMQLINGTTVNTKAGIYSSEYSDMTVAASTSILSSSQVTGGVGIFNTSAMPYTKVNSPTRMINNNNELQSPTSANSYTENYVSPRM